MRILRKVEDAALLLTEAARRNPAQRYLVGNYAGIAMGRGVRTGRKIHAGVRR
jgi:hypothetical protein